jgi:hypothetical protein
MPKMICAGPCGRRPENCRNAVIERPCRLAWPPEARSIRIAGDFLT